jgi:hypothetical protein
MYVCVCVCVYIYIYIYIYRERERERERERTKVLFNIEYMLTALLYDTWFASLRGRK